MAERKAKKVAKKTARKQRPMAVRKAKRAARQ